MSKIRPSRRHILALLTAGVATLTACDPEQEPAVVRDPYRLEEPLPRATADDLWLPTPFAGSTLVVPGWHTAPQHADGVYLAAAERAGVLEFTAVDVHGTPLWAVQRPASCTGFVVTAGVDGRALAILGDVESAADALATTTVTAYDLRTGETVWGPVGVPGPHQGPGLVFAAPPEAAMGVTGPRTVLDGASGRVADAEGDGADRVIGEYDGVALLVDDADLVARATADGQERWRISLAEHGWDVESVRAALQPPPGEGWALIDTSAATGVLIDLRDGAVRQDGVRDAAIDLLTETMLTLGESDLRADNLYGVPVWSVTVGPEVTIAAAGGVFLYLRDAGAVRVHNVLTGEVAEAYDPGGRGRIVVPEHITIDGAAVLTDGDRYLLATVGEQPDWAGAVGDDTPRGMLPRL